MIRTAAKYGTLAYVANKATKAYSESHQNSPSPQPQQPTYYGQNPPNTQGQGTQIREANGYLHQTWCNGQCGMHCNEGVNGHGNASRDMSRDVPRLGEAESYYGGFEGGNVRDGQGQGQGEKLPAYGKS